mmetsp:Transcript_154438/g.493958  ORF Transcript_154438/g.493958 Transcript_154438/m.493958 type:complete len:207 (+) Transcript_154438:1629-2249(+)
MVDESAEVAAAPGVVVVALRVVAVGPREAVHRQKVHGVGHRVATAEPRGRGHRVAAAEARGHVRGRCSRGRCCTIRDLLVGLAAGKLTARRGAWERFDRGGVPRAALVAHAPISALRALHVGTDLADVPLQGTDEGARPLQQRRVRRVLAMTDAAARIADRSAGGSPTPRGADECCSDQRASHHGSDVWRRLCQVEFRCFLSANDN